MKKLTLVLMAVVLGVLLTVPAFAFGPGEGRGPGCRQRMTAIAASRHYGS